MFAVDSANGRGDPLRAPMANLMARESVLFTGGAGTHSGPPGKRVRLPRATQVDLDPVTGTAPEPTATLLPRLREEHAGHLPFDYRQHFVVSFTLLERVAALSRSGAPSSMPAGKFAALRPDWPNLGTCGRNLRLGTRKAALQQKAA